MKRQLFYRNVRARDHLEIFLVSAVTSLLLLRFFLSISGYPQVGGGLHIAHMLYGGLLLMAALVIQLSFLGARIQRLSALIGGAGFGIFIDELGKFVTKDNDYFFRPTVGLIYAIFIILYLLFNFLGRGTERLRPREAELNALAQFEEAVLQDLDGAEKQRLHRLLGQADPQSPVTRELKALLERVDTIQPSQPRLLSRLITRASHLYRRFWHRRASSGLIAGLFVFEAVVFLVAVLVNVAHSFDSFSDFLHSSDSYVHRLVMGQLASSVVAGALAVYGAFQLRHSRLTAFEYFRRAVLINLLLTEFFIFSRIQFAAIPGFVFNLALLLALRYAIHQEQHPRS